MTDNAFGYHHSDDLKRVCAALEIRQKIICPHCPWQIGKLERLNAHRPARRPTASPLPAQRKCPSALAHWIEHYNTRRCNSPLGSRPAPSRL